MTDVLLSNTADGGEIEAIAGQITVDEGLRTAVFISLFGGNEDDSGDEADKPREFWGNKIETDATKKLRSRTGNLLRSIAITSGNLSLIQDAVAQDLQWMLDTKLADAAVPSVRVPALNTVQIDVKIEIQNKVYDLSFTKKTGATS